MLRLGGKQRGEPWQSGEDRRYAFLPVGRSLRSVLMGCEGGRSSFFVACRLGCLQRGSDVDEEQGRRGSELSCTVAESPDIICKRRGR